MSAAAPGHARPLARTLGAATLGLALGALLLGRTSAPAPAAARKRRAPGAPPAQEAADRPDARRLPGAPPAQDAADRPDARHRPAHAVALDGTQVPDGTGRDGAGRREDAGRRRRDANRGRRAHGTDSAAAAPAALQARRLYEAAALLAASVLSDSALEHYRGGFENPGMFAPLASAAFVLAYALHGARHMLAPSGPGSVPGRAGEPVGQAPTAVPFATACAVGAAGLGFHAYNVLRRPGGLSWGNLFYAAPLGAPAALALAGVIGLAARPVARGAPVLAGLPSGRALCGLAAFGLAGTSAEAALLHFRGAFQHPAMWLPVSVPPAAALLLAGAAVSGAPRPPRGTRLLLRACTWLGLIGAGFHTRGVARQMGGWRNWRQNLLAGPPLPAPPSFSALALAGRAALALRAAQAGRAGEAA